LNLDSNYYDGLYFPLSGYRSYRVGDNGLLLSKSTSLSKFELD